MEEVGEIKKKKEEVKERREKGKEEGSEGGRKTNGIWDR